MTGGGVLSVTEQTRKYNRIIQIGNILAMATLIGSLSDVMSRYELIAAIISFSFVMYGVVSLARVEKNRNSELSE